MVCWADYAWANSAYEAAEVIDARSKKYDGAVWFTGHWGFQYYMQANGHQALDMEYPQAKPGDIIIVPSNNSTPEYFPENMVDFVSVFEFIPCRWLATMDRSLGAGFYSDVWGPLPYVFGGPEPEQYHVFIVKQRVE